MKQAIEIRFKLPFEIHQFGDQFESSCPVLDVFSQGESEELAIENLKDALSLFLQTALSQQTLSQVLLDCGFEPGSDVSSPLGGADYLDVPVSLLAAQSQCHGSHA